MSAAEWLREKNSGAPADLLRAMLTAAKTADGKRTTQQLTSASRELAKKIAREGCARRDRALDLLTLDALITSALESSVSDADACEAAAGSLLSAIAEAANIE